MGNECGIIVVYHDSHKTSATRRTSISSLCWWDLYVLHCAVASIHRKPSKPLTKEESISKAQNAMSNGFRESQIILRI